MLKGPIAVRFEQVFPSGAYLDSEVEPVFEFENGKRGAQKVHAVTGEPLWEVTVIDGDRTLKGAAKVAKVKIAMRHQPVPPSSAPLTPIEFTDMTATPYISDNNGRPRLAWSYMARDMVAADAANS
ncbi:transcriptional regulator [Catellatospora coxensis]